jgi:hypothetical protein
MNLIWNNFWTSFTQITSNFQFHSHSKFFGNNKRISQLSEIVAWFRRNIFVTNANDPYVIHNKLKFDREILFTLEFQTLVNIYGKCRSNKSIDLQSSHHIMLFENLILMKSIDCTVDRQLRKSEYNMKALARGVRSVWNKKISVRNLSA